MLTLSLLLAASLGTLALVRAIRTAPVGFEDARGFHVVREACGPTSSERADVASSGGAGSSLAKAGLAAASC